VAMYWWKKSNLAFCYLSYQGPAKIPPPRATALLLLLLSIGLQWFSISETCRTHLYPGRNSLVSLHSNTKELRTTGIMDLIFRFFMFPAIIQ